MRTREIQVQEFISLNEGALRYDLEPSLVGLTSDVAIIKIYQKICVTNILLVYFFKFS